MENNLKTILRIIWIGCGILFVTLIIFTGMQIYFITKDVRNITSQMTIADMHRFMEIIENQQKIQLIEANK